MNSSLIAWVLALFITGGVYYASAPQSEPIVGAGINPFTSKQLAPSPTNTYILTTDGTNNSWAPPGAGTADGTWSTTSADFYKSVRNFFSTSSADYWETQQAARGGGGLSFGKAWEIVGGYLAPTTTVGILVNASSTIGSGTQTGGLTVSGGATTTGRFTIANTPYQVLLPSMPELSILGGTGNSAGFFRANATAAAGPSIIGYRGGTSPASLTAALTDYELLELTGRGFNGSAWTTLSAGAVRINASEDWDVSGNGTYVTFSTTPNNSTTEVERVRVDQDGTLDFTAYNCSANANGGALTVDASGNVTCTDDESSAGGFSTTSNDYWQTQRNFFSTTSADYWATQRNFFSTTSASFFSSLGLAWSTTSANHWETQQTARTADDLSDNSIEDLNDVAAMTENLGDLLYWNGSTWTDIATSSLNIAWSNIVGIPASIADGDSEFSTTSATFFSSLGLAFSTTSADYWETQQAARGGSGGASDFTWSSTFNSLNAATSSNLWVQGVLNATSSMNVTGLASFYNFVDIQGWRLSTTTTVCATGCEYTSIQTALDTLTGGGKIILKNESYTLGSTLSIPYNGITIEGEGIGTRLVCNPISANPCIDAGSGSGITHFNLNDLSVVNNGSAQTGVGVDFNETLVSGMKDVWIQSFATSTRVNDALDTDLIFYNNFRNIRATDTNVCFEFGGQANNNNVYDGRCAVLANGIGFYIASSTHNVTLNNINAEPAAGAGTIGVKVFDGSHNISIKGGHLEENATGVLVGSNSHHVSIDNTFFYSTISGATGVCQEAGAYAISLNNTYSIMESGTRYCSSLSEVMAFSADTTTHIGVGTTTAKTADTRLTLEKSVSLALSPMMWIRNTGAFAAGYAGIGFDNVPGAFADGLAKIGVVPGSGYAATSFTIHVADAAKALQERFRIDVAGRVYGSFFTATSTTAASVFPYASSTALTVSGTAYIGTLNGPLQANNGVVSATTSVGVLYGGTGLTSIGASSTALVSSGSAYVARNLDNWITSIITSASLVLTGVWDFSAAVLELPNAANGTVDAIGEVTIDTTDNQLVIATSTNASFPAVLPLTKQSLGSFLISSTSKPFSAGFVSGRSIPFKIHTDGYRVTEIVCDIDAGTSIIINFDNGTGNTETVTCDTDGASVAVSTNAVVTALSASAAIETGTVSGTPDYLRVSVFGVPTRE